MNKRKQVKRACINCQKAHAACDDTRPCNRCVTLNLAPTCEDVGRRKKQKLSPTSSPVNPASAYMNSFLNFVPPSTPQSSASSSNFGTSPLISATPTSFPQNSSPMTSSFPTKFSLETMFPLQETTAKQEEIINSLKKEIDELKNKLQQAEEEAERWKIQCEKFSAVLRMRTEASLDHLLSELEAKTSNLQHVHQFQNDDHPDTLIEVEKIFMKSRNRKANDEQQENQMSEDAISKLFSFCFQKSKIPISITGICAGADKIIACNDAFKELFGLTTKPKVSDYSWKELLHPVYWRIVTQEWINFAQVNLLQYKTKIKCINAAAQKYFMMEAQVDTICDDNDVPLFNLNCIIGKSELFDEKPAIQTAHRSGVEFSIPPMTKHDSLEKPLNYGTLIDVASMVDQKSQPPQVVPPSPSTASFSSTILNFPNITTGNSFMQQPTAIPSSQFQSFDLLPQKQGSNLLPSVNNLITFDHVPRMNSSFIPIHHLEQVPPRNFSSGFTPYKLTTSTFINEQDQEQELKRPYPF